MLLLQLKADEDDESPSSYSSDIQKTSNAENRFSNTPQDQFKSPPDLRSYIMELEQVSLGDFFFFITFANATAACYCA